MSSEVAQAIVRVLDQLASAENRIAVSEAAVDMILTKSGVAQRAAASPPATPSDAVMRAAEEIVKLTHSQDIDGGTKRITTAVVAIITRNLVATTSPSETADDETVSDDYAAGFENGSAFAVAVFLENLGHLNYVFDGMDCCKICGLVKPAEGWKKQCKGPTGLRINASPETAVGGDTDDLPVCLKCKHFENLDPRGRCVTTQRDSGGSLVYCACKCEFAAPVPAAGDDEGERPRFTTRATSLSLQGRCDHGEVLTASCDLCTDALEKRERP